MLPAPRRSPRSDQGCHYTSCYKESPAQMLTVLLVEWMVPEYRRNSVSRAGLRGAWNSPKSIEDNSLRDLGYSHAVLVARASVSFASAVSSVCPNLDSDFVLLRAVQPCVPGSQETPDSILGTVDPKDASPGYLCSDVR